MVKHEYLFILIGISEVDNSAILHEVLEMLPDLKQIPLTPVCQPRYNEVIKQFSEGVINSKEDYIAGMKAPDAIALKKLFPKNVILIFVHPPDTNHSESITNQPEKISLGQIVARLNAAEFENLFLSKCDYVITTNDKSTATEQLRAIILAERRRRDAILLWPIITESCQQDDSD